MKYLGHGFQGIVYDLGDGKVGKVFHNGDSARQDYELSSLARERGLKVPRPYEVSSVVLKPEDVLGIPRKPGWDSFLFHVGKAERSEGESLPMLVRQHIPGRSLDSFFFPRRSVKRKVDCLLEDFGDVGFVVYDPQAQNFVLGDGGVLYLVDGFSLDDKDNGWLQTQLAHARVTTSKLGDVKACVERFVRGRPFLGYRYPID